MLHLCNINKICFKRLQYYTAQGITSYRIYKSMPRNSYLLRNMHSDAKYSTAHKHKLVSDSTTDYKKPKVKLKTKPYEELLKAKPYEELLKVKPYEELLKTKPYEELLKVLETYEYSLKSNASFTYNYGFLLEKNAKITPATQPVHPYHYEGVYTVKPIDKSKKKKNALSPTKEKNPSDASKSSKQKKMSARQEEIKLYTRSTYAMRALKSFAEVAVEADDVEKAQDYLQKQLKHLEMKYKKKHKMQIDLYNILISGFARKGRVDKIKQLLSKMAEDSVEPNLQSYAGYLEGIASSKFIDVSEINQVVNDMKSKNLSHKDILQKCIFKGDQREKVIQALGFVDASLCTTFPFEREDSYSCKLLKKLNDVSYGRGTCVPDFCFHEADVPVLATSQLKVEENYSVRIASVDVVHEESEKTLKSRKYLEECEESWRKKLRISIKNFKNSEKKHFNDTKCIDRHVSVYPYISVIDNEILINILLQEVRLLAETSEYFNPMERVVCKGLGLKVMTHYFIWLNKKNKITDKVLFIYQKYLQYLLDPMLVSDYTPREYWEYLKRTHCEGPTIDLANTPWPHSVLVKIGSELFNILQKNIAFDTNRVNHRSPNKFSTQAFYTLVENWKDVKISKHIGTHEGLNKLYRNAKLGYLEFDATLLPMLSPSKPWVRHNSGGLLIIPTPFIRLNENAVHQTSHYAKVPSKDLNPCFDSLNSLSCCPWIINQPMLDVVIDVFQKGGNEELDIPLNPNSFPAPEKINKALTGKEKGLIWKQNKELKKRRCETTSLWFDCLYKLSIANHFRNKIFWFPHNLDFRGRVYPTPPHFNHLGSDMARSILLFAEGKPLGKNGLNWLKIQLINLTGFKKRNSLAERLEFANEMIPEILDSAERPFEGRQWWRKSDEPWQTLACCKELANALKHPNPEEYISHYPIHQDGSCNGLQHYAALGRDALGAFEVNLHPSNAPQDVYSGVSALVERERQKDAVDNVEIAKALDGFVKRKVVKQTVMTYVYGVTMYGAIQQILKQLKDLPDFPEKYQHEAARYLMKKIFFSIKEMFTATQQIQDWFTNCAEHITRISGDTVEWVTPLGLPVIQPYHKETLIRDTKCAAPLGKENLFSYSSNFEPYQLPNIRKQKNGFAPNFIHSLDASHMMLTSLFCQRYGITFVSVHDCYWTHASSVEIMNKICREQFVSLHKEPILEDLSAFFMNRYARVINEKIQGSKSKENSVKLKLRDILSNVPEKGTFDLEKVLESEYFFS